jgi:hypothetical protein
MTPLTSIASSPPVIAAPRAALWTAIALMLGALFMPDCCLAGRHAAGFGMEAFGPICAAAR